MVSVQAAQAVEHEGRRRTRLRAESHPRIARAAGRDERDDHADADVSRECQKAKQRVIMPDEQTHDEREQRRDGRGRDRVRVEDLEQLNVRRDDGDEVAAVAPLELRGQRRRSARKTLSRISASSLKAIKWLQDCSA